jgi:hypothetical protein
MGNYTYRNFGKADKNLRSEPFSLRSTESTLIFPDWVPGLGR